MTISCADRTVRLCADRAVRLCADREVRLCADRAVRLCADRAVRLCAVRLCADRARSTVSNSSNKILEYRNHINFMVLLVYKFINITTSVIIIK